MAGARAVSTRHSRRCRCLRMRFPPSLVLLLVALAVLLTDLADGAQLPQNSIIGNKRGSRPEDFEGDPSRKRGSTSNATQGLNALGQEFYAKLSVRGDISKEHLDNLFQETYQQASACVHEAMQTGEEGQGLTPAQAKQEAERLVAEFMVLLLGISYYIQCQIIFPGFGAR